jgi:hypothetical protein
MPTPHKSLRHAMGTSGADHRLHRAVFTLRSQLETSNGFPEMIYNNLQVWRTGESRPATPGCCCASPATRACGCATSRPGRASPGAPPTGSSSISPSRVRRQAQGWPPRPLSDPGPPDLGTADPNARIVHSSGEPVRSPSRKADAPGPQPVQWAQRPGGTIDLRTRDAPPCRCGQRGRSAQRRCPPRRKVKRSRSERSGRAGSDMHALGGRLAGHPCRTYLVNLWRWAGSGSRGLIKARVRGDSRPWS